MISILCEQNTLCRCLELQQQLCSLSTAIFAKNDKIKEGGEERERVEDLDTLPPPDSAQEVALRQVGSHCFIRDMKLNIRNVNLGNVDWPD